jgi:PTS system nitrogen regulatory IIA component
MAHEMMSAQEVADYLRRDARDVERLAERGKLPARKVGGQWRFSRTEVNHWLEGELEGLSEQELVAVEKAVSKRSTAGQNAPLVAELLRREAAQVPLAARTRGSVLKALVALAEQTGEVYDPTSILDAVRQREDLLSTALPGGVAIPHPRRPLPAALGDSIVAYGRTASGIPFGGPHGSLTDVFFLVCCRDDRTHLHVLARLSRLFGREGFLGELRLAPDAASSLNVIREAELALLSEQ